MSDEPLELLGVLRGEPSVFTREGWIALIPGHPQLRLMDPPQGMNLFTGQPMTLRPRPDLAYVVLDGEELGTLVWTRIESPEIEVFGDRRVIPLAEEIAATLGGRFETAR